MAHTRVLRTEGRSTGLHLFAYVEQADGEGESESCFLLPLEASVPAILSQLNDMRRFLRKWWKRQLAGEKVRIVLEKCD